MARLVAVSTLAAQLVFAFPSPADAQAGWTGVISEVVTDGSEAQIAFDAEGNGIATWLPIKSGGGTIRAARVSKDGTWSLPVDIASVNPEYYATWLRIDMNQRGDAVIVWTLLSISYDEPGLGPFAVRYVASTATWGPAFNINETNYLPTEAVIDDAGDIVTAWRDLFGTVLAARYTIGGKWTTEIIDAAARYTYYNPTLGVDGSGNVIAAWASGLPQTVRASRYSSSTQTWSAPVDISPPAPYIELWPNIVVDHPGNAVVTWTRYRTGATEATRYDASTSAWSATRQLSSVAPSPEYSSFRRPALATDAVGNVTIVWVDLAAFGQTTGQIRSSTYIRASDSWSPPALLANLTSPGHPQIAMDPAGNATVLWTSWPNNPPISQVTVTRRSAAGVWSPVIGPVDQIHNPHVAVDRTGNALLLFKRLPAIGGVYATKWHATPAAPVISTLTSAGSSVSISFIASPAQPGFETINYDYSINDGATWTTRTPASTVSPLVISGLAANTHVVRIRGVNGAGAGFPSSPVTAIAPIPPSPPTNLLGHGHGSELTLAWQNTFAGGTPTGIMLDVSGDQSASIALSLVDRFSFSSVPPGTYTFAVRAFNAHGPSGRSNSISFTFPGSCSPPATPTNFSATTSGNTIMLAWSLPASGSAPTGYIVTATGTLSGSFFSLDRWLSGTVGRGVYTLTVRATNACGASPDTAPQTVTIP